MAAMPVPTTGHEEDTKVMSHCLDFCQTLAGKSLPFSFSLTIGTSFSFSVDSTGKGASSPKKTKKKKATPSTLRHNSRRREEFLNKKIKPSTGENQSQSEQVSQDEAEGSKCVASPSLTFTTFRKAPGDKCWERESQALLESTGW